MAYFKGVTLMDPQDQPQNPTPQPAPPITPPVEQIPVIPQPEVVAEAPIVSIDTPVVEPVAIEPTSAPTVVPQPTPLTEVGQMPASFDAQSAPILPETPQPKSNTGLIIGLVVGGVVLLAIVGMGILFAVLGSKASDSESPSPSSSNSPSKANSAEVASSTFDYDAVCNGGSISNAAALGDKASAKIMTFSQSPRVQGSWSYESVGYGKPYYVNSTDIELVSVVACLEEVKSARAVGQTCDYKDDGKTVSIKYYSSQYKLSFYAAKTGKKASEGGTINAPANKCPSFISYDPSTLSAYASPDEDALDAKYTDFIAQ